MPNYPYSTRGSRSSRTGRVSSRLAQAEKKKVVRQTVILSFVAVILLLGFIFVILPAVTRFALSLSDTSFNVDNSDTFPPQVPIISAPVAATSSAQLAISGFGEAESEVVFVVNGREADRIDVDEDGTFSHKLSLTEGENTIRAYSIDKAENESGTSTTYTVIFDSEPPEIKLITPEDGQQFVSKANETITVEGEVEPNARVFVNGRRHTADSEGIFKASLRLNEGDNTITIRAEDVAGQTAKIEITVKYQE